MYYNPNHVESLKVQYSLVYVVTLLLTIFFIGNPFVDNTTAFRKLNINLLLLYITLWLMVIVILNGWMKRANFNDANTDISGLISVFLIITIFIGFHLIGMIAFIAVYQFIIISFVGIHLYWQIAVKDYFAPNIVEK